MSARALHMKTPCGPVTSNSYIRRAWVSTPTARPEGSRHAVAILP